MSGNTFELCRISTEWFHKLVKEVLGDKEFLGDSENCALVAPSISTLEGGGVWLQFYGSGNNSTKRSIHSIPHSSVNPKEIFVKEDVYFNICTSLGKDSLEEKCEISCSMMSKAFLPNLAASVNVAPIHGSCELAADDMDQLLGTYFEVPKYLCVDDVFAVSLEICLTLAKSPAYCNTSEFYFKVISAKTLEDENSIVDGFYILTNYTSLFCVTPVSSYLPPKSLEKMTINGRMTRVPPDLSSYVNQLKTLTATFIGATKPDCLPLFLMTGVPGSGKTTTINQSADSMGLNKIYVNAGDFMDMSTSALESKLDSIFKSVLKRAPCILVFTCLELLGKDKSGTEEPVFTNIFLKKVAFYLKEQEQFPTIVVGMADKKIDILPSLTRAFVHFIKFQPPNAQTGVATLAWFAANLGFQIREDSVSNLGNKIIGYVHDDLELLIKLAIRAMFEERNGNRMIEKNHLEKAIDIMEAAYSDAIGAAKVPNVRWDDIGGLSVLKDEIMLTLNTPLQRPGLLAGGLRRSGILFYGPPGTGKTLMAKAVATECAMNFLSVKGPELLNMYVGQSEQNVREVFSRGRDAAPCILFFDELDSLAPNRGKNGDSSSVGDRVVSQILAEMDGLQSNRGLFVIAATNRPDLVDPALLRPGRFDKMFYLGPCTDLESKLSVLKAQTNKFCLSKNVDLVKVAESLPEQVTGADVYSVCSNAWLSAARRGIFKIEKGTKVELPLEVDESDFDEGIATMVPSLSTKDLAYYSKLASSK